MINFQRCKPKTLEIYQIASRALPWDISSMAAKANKKAEAERRAREIHRRLMQIQPEGLTERQWTIKAGVSSSFFTNLLGNEKKPPSEPSIGNLRAVVEAAGSTLSEFFLSEARGRVIPNPPEEDAIEVFRDLVARMPKRPDARARFLNENVRRLLGLPPGPRRGQDKPADQMPPAKESSPPRRATS